MIRIKRGVYGRRVGNFVFPVRTGETCALDADEEETLVCIGVAEYVTAPKSEAKQPAPKRKKTVTK